MINWETNLVLVIKNKNIYEAIYNMFEVMKSTGRKIDINKHVSDLIKEKL